MQGKSFPCHSGGKAKLMKSDARSCAVKTGEGKNTFRIWIRPHGSLHQQLSLSSEPLHEHQCCTCVLLPLWPTAWKIHVKNDSKIMPHYQ